MFWQLADQHEIIMFIDQVVKIYLQVKNENKTSSIAVFSVIFKGQCSDIFGQKYFNIQIILCFQNSHKSDTNINNQRKIFKYLNIFKYSFIHWNNCTRTLWITQNYCEKSNKNQVKPTLGLTTRSKIIKGWISMTGSSGNEW